MKTFAASAILLFNFSAIFSCAQATVTFHNRNLTDPRHGTIYHAPVLLPDGSGAGPEFTPGLFLVTPGGPVLLAMTSLRGGAGGGFFSPQIVVRVPGLATVSTATFRVRVWETRAGSYDNAVANGFCFGEFQTTSGNNEITVVLSSDNLPGPLVPPSLNGILPLTLTCIPEPSTLSLAFILGLLLLRTRHSLRK